MKVPFFDIFAVKLDESLKKHEDNDIYVIICCAKFGRYEGNFTLIMYYSNDYKMYYNKTILGLPNHTNYPATRVYINPNHCSIMELKDR